LIAEAVVNAEGRRNQAEEFLSDEQAAAVKGGKIFFITCGGIRILPIQFPVQF